MRKRRIREADSLQRDLVTRRTFWHSPWRYLLKRPNKVPLRRLNPTPIKILAENEMLISAGFTWFDPELIKGEGHKDFLFLF